MIEGQEKKGGTSRIPCPVRQKVQGGISGPSCANPGSGTGEIGREEASSAKRESGVLKGYQGGRTGGRAGQRPISLRRFRVGQPV